GVIPIESMGAIDLVEFWRVHEFIYHLLHRIAMDVLPVRAPSVSSERVFSSSKMTCTAERSRLSVKTMEALRVLKHALKHHHRESSEPEMTLNFISHGAHSVCKIEFPEVLEEGTGKVKVSGLMDPRLGIVDHNFKCQTCDKGVAEYLGHFGHTEPVFHVGFLVKVKKILECIWVNYGKLNADIVSESLQALPFRTPTPTPAHFLGALSASRRTPSHLFLRVTLVVLPRYAMASESPARFHDFVYLSDPAQGDNQFADKIRHIWDPQKRMVLVWVHRKGKMICKADDAKEEGDAGVPAKPGHVQPLSRKEGLKLFLVYKKSRVDDEEMDGRTSQPENTLKEIPDSDLALLGLSEEFACPDWMIFTVLPVPPPPLCPSISADGGTVRSEADLTYKLGDVLKASINIQ
ncbi:DNA-directed RNA polymerase II subunit rpb1, partial [Ceratobasidium sp. 423]